MPSEPAKRTRSRKTSRRRRKQNMGFLAVVSKQSSIALDRLTFYFKLLISLARQHLVIICAAGTCIILGLAVWGLAAWLTAPAVGPEVGNRAPDFILQTVEGNNINLRDFKGKMVILDFWQAAPSLCPSSNNSEDGSRLSRELQPVLDKWTSKKLEIIAISPLADSAKGKDLASKIGINFPIALDPSRKTYADYDITCDPTRVFIDKSGIIRAVMLGPAINQDEIENALNSIADNKATGGARPAISNTMASSITDRKAVINFTTDKPAVSWIITDKCDSLFCIKSENTTATSHTIILDGLQPTTTYHFRVFSSPEHKIESPAVSRKYALTTLADTTPPVISNVEISDITASSAMISWATDESAIGQVYYAPKGYINQTTKSEGQPAISHNINLADLDPEATYQFTIKSIDATGNEATFRGDLITAIPEPVKIGDHAPNFTLPKLDGKSATLNDFKGKIVMVHFWSALCVYCKAEMPLIQEIYDKFPDDKIAILAIDYGDRAEVVKEFIETQSLTLPILLDSEGKVKAWYQPEVFPTTYFVDGDGIVKNIHLGSFLGTEDIEEVLRSL